MIPLKNTPLVYELLLLGTENNASSVLVNISKAKFVGRVDPVLLLAPGAIHLLEIIVSLNKRLRDVSAGFEVNALPGTNTSIDILERLGVKDGHGSALLLLTRQQPAVDTSETNSRFQVTVLPFVLVHDKDFQEIGSNKAMQAVEMLRVIGHCKSDRTLRVVTQ